MHRYMRRIATASVLTAFCLAPAQALADDDAPAQRVTYTKDVLPILQENCQTCHRPAAAGLAGMIAPMSLMTYREVRPWAKSMANMVRTREMPPWHATGEFKGVFENERTLSDDEIATIVKWAATGAVQGRVEDAPAPLVFEYTDGWSIGLPDLVVPFTEPFFVADNVQDQYATIRVTLTEEQLPEDKWIQAMEYKPGSEAVHHIIGSAYPPGERTAQDRGLLGGIAPGTDPDVLPVGYGKLLRKGSTINFAMHYHKESGPGTGVWDRTAIAFKFHDQPVTHNVRWDAIGNRNFEIPPGHAKWQVGAARTFRQDTTILAFLPHMHLRGEAASYVAFYPDGTEEVLLDVPVYDFNWQTNYFYKEPKEIPAGTRIEVSMWFNNSPERGDLANIDSRRAVRNGGPTTDEMMLGWIDYTETKPMAAAGGTQ